MTSPVAQTVVAPEAPPARLPLPALAIAALVALPLAAAIGGAAAAPVVGDAGGFVRWGVLYARVVHDLAASATIGLLIHAAYLVPETTRTDRRITATRLAGIAAGLWAIAGAAVGVLGMADTIGIPLTDPAFAQQFTAFAWTYEPTRVALITAGVAALVSVVALVVTSRAAMAWLSAISVIGVLPLALAGHSAGATDHSTAVNALAIHLVGVTVWVGGLLALALLRPMLGGDLAATAARYSVLAGWCFAAVALSGLQSALIRVGPWSDLGTRYGVLLMVKTAALLLLGYAGWRHRRSLLAGLGQGRTTAFVRLVAAELVVMGVAFGTAVALARSAPPVARRARRGRLANAYADGLPRPRTAHRRLAGSRPGPSTGSGSASRWWPWGSTSRECCACAAGATRGRCTGRSSGCWAGQSLSTRRRGRRASTAGCSSPCTWSCTWSSRCSYRCSSCPPHRSCWPCAHCRPAPTRRGDRAR